MKLSYFVCHNLVDHALYNIRARGKKEANALRDAEEYPEEWSKAYRVIVEYKNGFDLVEKCMGWADRGDGPQAELSWEKEPPKKK
jgi:hypothetical protein